MRVAGPRPPTVGVRYNEFEPGRVYLRGDSVLIDGKRWEAVADFRAGFLPPDLVAEDCPGEFWRPLP